MVNERIFFLFIYSYLTTWSMECLLKNKECFTSAYFFSWLILHTINKNQLSLCKKFRNCLSPRWYARKTSTFLGKLLSVSCRNTWNI